MWSGEAPAMTGRGARAGPDPWAAPRVFLAGARAVYAGPGMSLTPHRLAVATLVFALDHPFRLERLPDGGETVARVGLIPPDCLHHLQTSGRMLFLYLDALGDDWAGLDPGALDAARHGIAALLDGDEAGPCRDAVALTGGLCARIGLPRREVTDARIAAVVRAIDAAPGAFATIRPAAALAGLSVPRFQHLFRDSLGTPFRRYRLWRRMAVVAEGLSLGRSLTDAALDAGFSGSAHLSAAFRAMFGLRPSDLVARGTRFAVDRTPGGYSAASAPRNPPDCRAQ